MKAPAGDVTIQGRSIDIVEARNQSAQDTETRFKQSGLSVSLSAPGVDAALGAIKAGEHVTQTQDDRMKALAAATAISKAKQALDEIQKFNQLADADKAQSIRISLSVGSQQSKSSQHNESDQAAGSTVLADGKLSLIATGGGQDSNVTVRGSSLAGQDVLIKADNAIHLLAAQNTSEQHSKDSSSSASIGVGISLGKEMNAGFTASGSVSKGNADGKDTNFTTTTVTGGSSVTLQSGGDTALKGAVVSGPKVVANVGGNLSIESLQDTAKFDSKSQSVGGSVTVGAGAGGSANFSQSKVNADYAAVGEQAGIRAGDGGFQVSVKGNTDLKGGAITSSQAAIDAGKNSLSTGTLTSSDIDNRSQYSATAVTVSAGTSGGMAGAFKDSGDERSTISAGNTVITSGDAASQAALDKLDRGATSDATAGKLAQGWDGQQLAQQAKLNAQIVAEFGAEAAKRVAEYAKGKLVEAARLEAKADEAKDTPEGDAFAAEAAKLREQWDVDGSLRIAAHAAIGGLTGNMQGALGAAAGTFAAPKVGDALIDAGLDPELTKNLVALASTAVGATVGGTSGAAAALNEAENNYRTMSPIRDVRTAVNKAAAQLYDKCGANCSAADYQRMDEQLVRIESSSTLLHFVVNGGGLTEKQAAELAQTVSELLPIFGSAESVAQVLTGKATLTGEETNRYLAAVGTVPVLGFLFKRMPKDIPGRVAYLMQDAKAYMEVDNAAKAAEKIAEAGKLAGVPVDAQAVAKRLGELSEAGEIKKINIVDPGAKGDWGKAINGELQKDAAYVLTNGHSYVTDAAGRVKEVAGELSLNKLDRNAYAQCVTGKCGDVGDEGGHRDADAAALKDDPKPKESSHLVN